MVFVGIAAAAGAVSAQQMRSYDTRYYVIQTDLDVEAVRETAIHLTVMAEEYHQRTRGFAGQIDRRLPFMLFSDPAGYYGAGGMPGSAGVFTGDRLMAMAPGGEVAWHVVQHEGFHQFVHYVIGTNVPIWVNEGLAEYFGHALFTGDDLVTGIFPPRDVRRLQAMIRADRLKSIEEMMTLSHRQWNAEMDPGNYILAWSMVHFLVHGEDGRYVESFEGFMRDIGRRRGYADAWARNFGRDIDGFEQSWRQWWLDVDPDDINVEANYEAMVRRLTAFVGRYQVEGQHFDDFDAFVDHAQANPLELNERTWLPPSLLAEALASRRDCPGELSLEDGPSGSQVVCTLDTGERLIGRYEIRNRRVDRVRFFRQSPGEDEREAAGPTQTASAEAPADEEKPKDDPPAPAVAGEPEPTARAETPEPPADPLAATIRLARNYIAIGRADRARQMLIDDIAANPDSPSLDQARALLAEIASE